MSVAVVVIVKPLPEYRDEVTEAFKALVPQVHAQEGVERYVLLTTADELVVVESWVDQASLDAHSAASPSQEIRKFLAGKLSEPAVSRYLAPISAGDPVLGTL